MVWVVETDGEEANLRRLVDRIISREAAAGELTRWVVEAPLERVPLLLVQESILSVAPSPGD